MERTQNQNEVGKVFETSNLDLGAYLMLEGVRYLGCRIEIESQKRKPLAVMQFHDEKLNARDLERVFMTSTEKRYRDLTKYLLKEVHKEIKRFTGETHGD